MSDWEKCPVCFGIGLIQLYSSSDMVTCYACAGRGEVEKVDDKNLKESKEI